MDASASPAPTPLQSREKPRDTKRTRSRNPGEIEVKVRSVQQLFDSMDPSPFIERDLDPDAEAFIRSWAREMPRVHALRLRVYISEEPPFADYRERLTEGIANYFSYRASMRRSDLRELLRRGRKTLGIGLLCLAISLLVADALAAQDSTMLQIVGESVIIAGWVAMWRPLEIFLYEWWPIRDDARLYERLTGMPVEFVEGWRG